MSDFDSPRSDRPSSSCTNTEIHSASVAGASQHQVNNDVIWWWLTRQPSPSVAVPLSFLSPRSSVRASAINSRPTTTDNDSCLLRTYEEVRVLSISTQRQQTTKQSRRREKERNSAYTSTYRVGTHRRTHRREGNGNDDDMRTPRPAKHRTKQIQLTRNPHVRLPSILLFSTRQQPLFCSRLVVLAIAVPVPLSLPLSLSLSLSPMYLVSRI